VQKKLKKICLPAWFPAAMMSLPLLPSCTHVAASSGGCDRFSPPLSSSAHFSLSPSLAASVCVDDRSSSARDSTSTSSAVSLSAHEIAQLRCLLDAWDSSMIGSAGFTTDFSDIEKPPL
jgi:hypothetical protein